MRYFERYKTMLVNDKLVHISVADEIEERLMDREQVQMATRLESENAKGPAS